MKKAVLTSAFLTMFIGSTAFAASALPPDLGGSTQAYVRTGGTGVIDTPTAEALDAGHFSLIHHNLPGDATLSQAHFGIGGNIEIGVTGYRSDAGNTTYGNVKYQFLKESIATPGLAIGVLDITDKYGRNAYIAGTKTLPVLDTKISLGMYQKGDNKVFASLEQPILSFLGTNTFPSTTIKVEYNGDDVNFGLALATVAGVKLEVGSRNDHGYWGASWTF